MTGTIITPNPLSSDVEYRRYYHFDIPYLELDDLQDELYALRPVLWGLPPTHWLRERVKILERPIKRNTKMGEDDRK